MAPLAFGDEPLFPGDYFQLTCAVTHGDFPLNITWFLNDEPIFNQQNDIMIQYNGKRSSSLTIDSVTGSHAGNYTCIGSNRAGQSISSTTLSVKGLCFTTFLK